MAMRRPAIGVFDSGFGGLTVLKELIGHSLDADYLYFGDTARLPYGSKSTETVSRFALGACQYLEDRGAQLLVIACNTATALALGQISAAAHVPVVGVIEPGAECAAAASRSRKVVVLATEATVSSHAYQKALAARGIEAREKACPLLVPLVEEGWVDHPITEQVAQIYVDQAFGERNEADVLLLGCTHYPLLKPLLRRIAPRDVTLVDSAESAATAVRKKLKLDPLPRLSEAERRSIPRLNFFATDSVEKFRRLGAMFLCHRIDHVEHVDLKE
ncbi:MAG: glutamate racemase [Acidobacteria bacterium]|nr:glutamate racemase [Acidobacteriota bacterium]